MTHGLHKLLRLAASIAVLFGATLAFAASRVDCSKITSKALSRSVPYCVMLPPGYDENKSATYPVLYYLHGLGDNEQSIVNGGGWNIYEDLLSQKKVPEFIIVTPYGYRSFYVNSRDGKFPYETFFVREFMPAIEKKYRIKAGRDSRAIMGISMGGYGAFHYAFKYPEKFVSLSTHMAALSENPPSNLSGTPGGRLLVEIFGDPLDKSYYLHNSPFTFARTQPAAALRRLAIYFDVGDRDDYGFEVGNAAMDKALTARGIKHEFHLNPGRHDWAYVIDHFGQSLQFHGKAFASSAK